MNWIALALARPAVAGVLIFGTEMSLSSTAQNLKAKRSRPVHREYWHQRRLGEQGGWLSQKHNLSSQYFRGQSKNAIFSSSVFQEGISIC